jgi:putative oxidoreductase
VSTNATKNTLQLLLRIALAAVFVWAALPKLVDPGEFASAIQNYRVVPESYVGVLAVLVPVFELVVALALLTPTFQHGAALLAALMLAAFAIAMAQARARGIDLRCGCFGATFEAKVSWLTVARSAGLSGLAWLAFGLGGASTNPQTTKATNADGTPPDPPVLSS